MIAAHVQGLTGGRGNAGISSRDKYENGTWYFVVLTWSWPFFSMSVNGKPFSAKSLSHIPDEILDKIKSFIIGSPGGGAPTLIDEVMIFNRPLTAAETKLIYENIKAWSKKK